jgi:hypothetical protein
MKRELLAAALATGCFSTPDFSPDPLVSHKQDDTGVTVGTDGFTLHFAGGSGFHFPDSLMLGTDEVIGRDPMQGCDREEGIGLRFLPAARISASSEGPVAQSSITSVMTGPAIVQVRVEWTTRFTCNPNRNPNGSSTFTVFPDRRIIRHDVFTDPIATAIDATQCSCQGPGQGPGFFNLGTYWTFSREAFQKLYLSERPESVDLPGPGQVHPASVSVACVEGGTHRTGFAWRGFASGDGDAGVFSVNALFGFSRNLGAVASQLAGFEYRESSAAFFDPATCAEGFNRAEEYSDPMKAVKLVVDGVPIPASERDGIYGGDSGAGLPGLPVPSGGQLKLGGPTRTPFAVWLRFPRKAISVKATRPGATGAWYLPQKVDDVSWIVWFRDKLEATETITVGPR